VLREELLTRARNDRAARHAHSAGETPWSVVEQVDIDNLAFLTRRLSRYGWLGSDLVGSHGAHACWLLVQVRHEALFLQVEVRGLHRRSVAAGRRS
jgi:hypothetical protein